MNLLCGIQETVKTTIRNMLTHVLEAELAVRIRAVNHERSALRKDYRNGFFKRSVKVDRFGLIKDIRVPRSRHADIKLQAVALYKSKHQKINQKLIKGIILGLDEFSLEAVLNDCFSVIIPRELIREVCRKVAECIESFRNPPIRSQVKYLILEAVWLLEKGDQKGNLKPLFVAVGVDAQLSEQVLSVEFAGNETAIHWHEFLGKLKKRGLSSRRLEAIVYGSIFELKNVLKQHFGNVVIQRCLNSKLSRILDHRNFSDLGNRDGLQEELQSAFQRPSKQEARIELQRVVEKWRGVEPRSVQFIEEDWTEILNYFSLPSNERNMISTVRLAQPAIAEIGKNTDMITIYKNIGSQKNDYLA